MLAQEWFYGFVPRPVMSIKVERQLHDMRILGRVLCASGTRLATTVVNTKYETIRTASFNPNTIIV